MLKLNVDNLTRRVATCNVFRTAGKLRSARGILTAAVAAAVGQLCQIETPRGETVLAEVVGVGEGLVQLLPFSYAVGLPEGAHVVNLGHGLRIPVGPQLLGRVVDGLGVPIDGQGPLRATHFVEPPRRAPQPLDRPKIVKPFVTGQRAIDGLLTFGQGQRVGLFAGGGVGKSTLLSEIAKYAESDLNVIALVGERGREVRPFLEDCLGASGLSRSVVLVSTSDESPLMRVRCAQAAVAIADYFRQHGANVLFLLDSVTRLATAQREIGLLVGEPPSARGFTPSVFQLLARTLEQLGRTNQGTITAILTVLVDGDDIDEPVSDAVRAIIDGHIVLDRKLAEQGHFPAIDVARSVSRVMVDVIDAEHRAAARKLRAAMATYAEMQDLIRVGAYAQGSAPEVDRAIALRPMLQKFLRQETGVPSALQDTEKMMHHLAQAWPY